jgi:uncharacterized lipoprotein
MKTPFCLLPAALVLLLCGCSGQQLSRNIYEGSRSYQEGLRTTPLENPRTPDLRYEQYEKERQERRSGR